jgi:glutamine amidotransferase
MIAIIKYNAGNVASVKNALNRLGANCVITDSIEEISKADKVIFPGVGEASSAMKHLIQFKLDDVIKNLKQPLLGICLGQQLMCSFSEEGNTNCLGIFDAKVKKLPANEIIPHMGWNSLKEIKSKLLKGITETDDVYFVHNYYTEINQYTTSICDYILPFTATMEKNNFFAAQFHPEKSADVGDKILINFINL